MPRSFNPSDLDALLELNRLREAGGSAALQRLEHRFATDFAADHHLAVYGSLAPGRQNHHELSHLVGEWHSGYFVTGELIQTGWATDLGYPALRWSPTGELIEVQLFVSAELPQHWARLDEFEGPEYVRILVPLHRDGIVAAVANLYAARP